MKKIIYTLVLFIITIATSQTKDIQVNLSKPQMHFEITRLNINQVNLDWHLSKKSTPRGFYIERMLEIEGVFETIKYIKKDEISQKSVVDNNSYTRTSYYRLKLIDINGGLNYSKIKSVPGSYCPK